MKLSKFFMIHVFIASWMISAPDAFADPGNVLYINPCAVRNGTHVGECEETEATPGIHKDTVQHKHLEKEKLQRWFQWEKVSETSIRIFFHKGDSSCYGNRAVMLEDREKS